MADRTIYFASTIEDAVYRMGDPAVGGGGDFIVVEDLDGDTVLLEYDTAQDAFVQRATLDMDGNNIANVGALDAQSAQVTDAPTQPTDVARKAETDTKADNPLSQTLDANGNDIEDVGSLNTGSAIIGGQQADYHWEHLTTVTDSQSSGSDLPVDLPLDLEPHDEIMLRYDAQVSGDAGDITLRRQGDGASNSNYEHVDISGNLTADAAALPLFNKGNTNFPVSVAGDLWIEEVSFGEVGISHRLGPTRLSNITTWSIAGTYDGGDDFSDISLDAPGYFDSIKVEVFARSEIE